MHALTLEKIADQVLREYRLCRQSLITLVGHSVKISNPKIAQHLRQIAAALKYRRRFFCIAPISAEAVDSAKSASPTRMESVALQLRQISAAIMAEMKIKLSLNAAREAASVFTKEIQHEQSLGEKHRQGARFISTQLTPNKKNQGYVPQPDSLLMQPDHPVQVHNDPQGVCYDAKVKAKDAVQLPRAAPPKMTGRITLPPVKVTTWLQARMGLKRATRVQRAGAMSGLQVEIPRGVERSLQAERQAARRLRVVAQCWFFQARIQSAETDAREVAQLRFDLWYKTTRARARWYSLTLRARAQARTNSMLESVSAATMNQATWRIRWDIKRHTHATLATSISHSTDLVSSVIKGLLDEMPDGDALLAGGSLTHAAAASVALEVKFDVSLDNDKERWIFGDLTAEPAG